MSDRIAVMNEGQVEQIGGPEDVYERPATTFVAGFIGVSNLLPAETVSANGKGSYASVRPEKLRVEDPSAPSTADHPSVDGVVESTLYLGTATQLVVKVGDDVPMTVLVPNADEADRQGPARRGLPRTARLGPRAHAPCPRVTRGDPPANETTPDQALPGGGCSARRPPCSPPAAATSAAGDARAR